MNKKERKKFEVSNIRRTIDNWDAINEELEKRMYYLSLYDFRDCDTFHLHVIRGFAVQKWQGKKRKGTMSSPLVEETPRKELSGLIRSIDEWLMLHYMHKSGIKSLNMFEIFAPNVKDG